MSDVHVKRNGKICTVYEDMVTGEIHPLTTYEDAPETAFPYTASEIEIKGKFPGRKLVFFDAPKRVNPVSTLVTTDEDMVRAMPETAKLMGERMVDSASEPAPKPTIIAGKFLPDNATQAKIVDAFVELMRNCRAARGKEAKALSAEVEAVGSFLINADASFEKLLIEARERLVTEKKKFSLGV